jgi:ABC-type transport system involved in multi-copper enzyme maturation permease subunit
MQTVASKPIPRSSIVLGKWLAHAAVLAAYVLLVAGGVVVSARLITGVLPPNLFAGLGLLMLEGLTVLTVSIALGTRVSTIANGITCVGLYGMAFLGGWFEQIGTFANVKSAATVGTITSLLFPSESMWQLAAHTMQPAIVRDLNMTPFSPASVPSGWMVVWTGLYVVAMLAWALRTFSRRSL